MYKVDVPKVRGKMAERGITMTQLSETLDISRNTLSGYFSTPTRIPYHTLSKMAEVLCDDQGEAAKIFFAQ